MRYIVFIAVSLLVACHHPPAPVVPTPPEKPVIDPTPPPPPPPEEAIHPVARFKRTPCFGKCPAYEFTLNSDGTALYKGTRFVEKAGQYVCQVPADWHSELLKKAQDMGFFEMESFYPVDKKIISDLPNLEMMLESKSAKKEIKINHDAPETLRLFSQDFEKMIESLHWKKAEE